MTVYGVFSPEQGILVLASFIVSLALVATKSLHGTHTLDVDHGVQKFHVAPTPRVGGLSMVAGLVVGVGMSQGELRSLLFGLCIAALPAFLAGFVEDITKNVGVSLRLFFTMLSGLVAWWITGTRLDHLDLPGVDSLLAVEPVSVMFTAFAVGGIASAINIIDGFNGLAGGVAGLLFAALCAIALSVGDLLIAEVCLVMMLVLLGFLLVNFPFGKIFMGDGGAYLLGFMLAWVSLMLVNRNPEVSVWAPATIAAYPIVETLFSMLRRLFSRHSPSAPDVGHLHSLVKVKVIRRYAARLRPSLRNALVSPFCWFIAAVPAAAGAYWHYDTHRLQAVFAVWTFCYLLLYVVLSRQPDGQG